MTFHILPKLKPDHNVQTINEAGKWAISTRDLLNQLRKGLKVDKVETEINSIPDMWARPMLFQMALFDERHVLHDRILGEWRGLLAMIALKEVAKLDRFTASRVEVPVVTQLGENESQSEDHQRDFVGTLSKLLPTATLAGDTSWQVLYTFLFNGQPVGMTSPTTLVATASDYLNRISSQEVRWYNGTHLKDPVKILPPSHREILSGWLDNLHQELEAHLNKDADLWNSLSGMLKAFRKELGSGKCSFSQSRYEIHGTEVGIFKYLDKPADGNLQNASHVMVIPSQGRAPEKPLLVFDRSIASQWNLEPQDVTVYGGQTLASAAINVKHADVWKVADFFTKTLFVIFQENAFPGTAGNGHQSLVMPGGTTSITPILPLNWELLNHLTGVDLAQFVRWHQVPEGLKIELSLRVSGPNPNESEGRAIELSRVYKPEEIQTLSNVPILEIWPYLKAANWNAYFTCYSTDDSAQTFAARPFTIGEMTRSEVELGGRAQRKYWRTESYPDAMVCTGFIANPKSNQMESAEAGILLLSQPSKERTQGLTFQVGVDFGASSTTVCARNGENAFKIGFADLKKSITASGAAQARLFDFFLPTKQSEMPVLSFFHDFNNNLEGDTLQPFLDGHAYLLETADSFDPETKGLAFDLKWSRDKDDRKRAQAFLHQLCLQASAELVLRGAAKCEWGFSYPSAFSGEQIKGFPSIWGQVIEECSARSGLKHVGDNKSLTESDATAFYFVRHRKAATAYGTVFMDIGGSTSDISVWQDDKPVWQTSVLLAGRSIFSNYLWHHPEFLGLFGAEFKRLPELKTKCGDDRRPYHALTDALLRYKTKQIFQKLPVLAGTDEVSALRQHLAVGVSGLFFYLGMVLKYLTDSGFYRKSAPNVYVGGNGSLIFRWLDIDRDEQINGLYKAMFSRGAGWAEDKPFEVFLSAEPKTEAAYGLVSGMNRPSANVQNGVLAGEVFMALEKIPGLSRQSSTKAPQTNGPRKIDWDTILTASVLTKRLAPSSKLERLAEFMDHFNAVAQRTDVVPVSGFTPQQSEEVRRRLEQSLARYRGVEDPKNVIVEPVFILALRHFLEIRLRG